MPRKNPLAPLKVYLSSTYEDLKDYREAVYRQLRSLRHDVIAMEDYVAADQRPLERCLKDVRDADVYVGLFAWRYGYVPKQRSPRHLSITELELREAQKKGKPTLLFLLHDRRAWPPLLMDSSTGDNSGGQRIRALRAELMSERLVSTFESPEELAAKALASLVTWQIDSSAEGVEEPAPARVGKAEPRGDGTNCWKPGSTLRVRFLEKADTMGDRILRIAQIWNAYANVRFTLSQDEDAEVRVAFSESLASWSYVGTQCLEIARTEPTMNLGWLKEDSAMEEMERTVLHEFGHALGLLHEHNNPASSLTLKWDRPKVYAFYKNHGWDKATVDRTVFSTWPKKSLPFDKPFDPSSVMMYPVAPELLREREPTVLTTNLALSAGDKVFVNRLYPYR